MIFIFPYLAVNLIHSKVSISHGPEAVPSKFKYRKPTQGIVDNNLKFWSKIEFVNIFQDAMDLKIWM